MTVLAAGACTTRPPLQWQRPPISYMEPGPPTEPPQRTDTVATGSRVSVRDAAGRPIAHAQAILSPDTSFAAPHAVAAAPSTVVTDSAGRFAVEATPGAYRLRVREWGFVGREWRLVVLRDAPVRELAITLDSAATMWRQARRAADSADAVRLASRRKGASACLQHAAHSTLLIHVLRRWLDDGGDADRRRDIAKWGLTGVDTTDTEVITDADVCQAAADTYAWAGRGAESLPRDRAGHSLASVFVVRVGRAYAIEVPGRHAGEWTNFLLAVRTRRGFAMRDWLSY